MATINQIQGFFRKRGIFIILHVIILLLSILLIVMISIDTFHNVSFYEEREFQKGQFWICVVFLLDFFAELLLSENKWQYLRSHILFFLVSIPYQAIIYHNGWHLSQELAYVIRYMPLVRGGYAMAIVVGWFTSNKTTGLFFTYLITLISSVYFASLTFFLFEYQVNPGVNKYSDALWWAFMDMTTVGSSINPVTNIGRVLAVVLAALGMMMFPIFTVYITNMLHHHHANGVKNNNGDLIGAYRAYIKNHPADAQVTDKNVAGRSADSDNNDNATG
ncbi:MAG: potassium channel family protein [Candidatus Amulumruptor caecigallinarius]|nr:potassium channel family protein [Candidatus Amulumruptor caecigallinarius]